MIIYSVRCIQTEFIYPVGGIVSPQRGGGFAAEFLKMWGGGEGATVKVIAKQGPSFPRNLLNHCMVRRLNMHRGKEPCLIIFFAF